MATTIHASESQHWYWPDGKPAYEVLSADGKKMVNPDVRHARKLGLVPGVSSIINCAAKPGLENWKIDQAILAALTLPRKDGELDEDFVARVKADSKEQAAKAAEKGTAIHAAIQKYYESGIHDIELGAYSLSVGGALYNQYGDVKWEAEKSFAHPMGYGGKKDLCAPRRLLDIKTKEFDEMPTEKNKVKLAWDEHCIQLAAYRSGQDDGTADCANVFVSTSKPGLVYIHEWSEEELERGWKMFRGLLDYWAAKNKYNGAF